MRVIFSTLAKQELEDAARYYELEHEGLGDSQPTVFEKQRAALLPRPTSVTEGTTELLTQVESQSRRS